MSDRFYNIPDDADFFAFESAMAAFDIDMRECDILMEMIDTKLNLNIDKSNLKVYSESGTYDDLKMLYTEAEDQAGKEKQGVIRTIFDSIGKAIQSIINFFKGLFTKKVDDPETEVQDITPNETSKLDNFKNALPKVAPIVAAVASGTVAGAAAIKVYKDKFADATKEQTSNDPNGDNSQKTTKKNLLQKINIVPGIMADAQKVLNSAFKSSEETTDQDKKSFFSDVMNWIRRNTEWVGQIGGRIGKIFGLGDNTTSAPSGNKSESKDNTQTSGNNNSGSNDNNGNTSTPNNGSSQTQSNNSSQASGNGNSGQTTNESVDDAPEGDEFMETALDRVIERIYTLLD